MSTVAPRELSPLRRPVGIYILIRLFAGLLLLALAGFTMAQGSGALWVVRLEYALAAVLFLAMGLSAALLPRFGDELAFAWSQVILDTVFVTTLVLATGGASSPYLVVFFMNIVASAWLLPARGPLVLGVVDSVAFATMMGLTHRGRVGDQLGQADLLAYTQALLHIFGFFLVAWLSGLLAERLSTTRVALAHQMAQRQQLQQRHDVVLDNLDTGVVLVDADGVPRHLSPAAQQLLGGERQALSVLAGGSERRRWELAVEREGRVQQLVFRRSPLPDGGAVLLVEDVTRAREMEAAVAREERLAAVGRLAAGLAHEIRNPLASLSGAVQLLRDENPGPLHGIVLREVKRLDQLVEDFLFSARPVDLKVEDVDVAVIIDEVCAAFSHDGRYTGRQLAVSLAADLPRVRLDGARFRQVLWNLLLNAAQATVDGDRIAVRTRMKDGELSVTVEDSGHGIPPEQLGRIFDPFHTTRSGGTGLGLANVDRVLRAHGGRVEVHSGMGEGTEFILHFPVTAGATPPDTTPPDTPPAVDRSEVT